MSKTAMIRLCPILTHLDLDLDFRFDRDRDRDVTLCLVLERDLANRDCFGLPLESPRLQLVSFPDLLPPDLLASGANDLPPYRSGLLRIPCRRSRSGVRDRVILLDRDRVRDWRDLPGRFRGDRPLGDLPLGDRLLDARPLGDLTLGDRPLGDRLLDRIDRAPFLFRELRSESLLVGLLSRDRYDLNKQNPVFHGHFVNCIILPFLQTTKKL